MLSKKVCVAGDYWIYSEVFEVLGRRLFLSCPGTQSSLVKVNLRLHSEAESLDKVFLFSTDTGKQEDEWSALSYSVKRTQLQVKMQFILYRAKGDPFSLRRIPSNALEKASGSSGETMMLIPATRRRKRRFLNAEAKLKMLRDFQEALLISMTLRMGKLSFREHQVMMVSLSWVKIRRRVVKPAYEAKKIISTPMKMTRGTPL